MMDVDQGDSEASRMLDITCILYFTQSDPMSGHIGITRSRVDRLYTYLKHEFGQDVEQHDGQMQTR